MTPENPGFLHSYIPFWFWCHAPIQKVTVTFLDGRVRELACDSDSWILHTTSSSTLPVSISSSSPKPTHPYFRCSPVPSTKDRNMTLEEN